MNSRERVRACFEHREPDRVPIDFGGWLSGIKKSAHRKLSEHLGIGAGEWQAAFMSFCEQREESLSAGAAAAGGVFCGQIENVGWELSAPRREGTRWTTHRQDPSATCPRARRRRWLPWPAGVSSSIAW